MAIDEMTIHIHMLRLQTDSIKQFVSALINRKVIA